MSAVLRTVVRYPLTAFAGRAGAQRFLWIKVHDGQDPSRIASRMQTILAEDGSLKTLALKRFHEKKWQKRKRKAEEQNIRRANRRVGSMIDFILRRKQSGH
ncbi:unnamed protein product [Peronospora belbahrii]|uniref:Ribosomal protein S21 n=1 Tax=Peronospora belbahrii TaxID=622444 RepID=A0AAU9L4Y1_9STRA|nr:unnamed protein product [Peronospora belbahrii]CAH0513631.1 unnamed protein product [Peronospora belbahrii]